MAIYSVNVSTPSAGAGAKSDYIQREGKYEGKKEELLCSESGNLPSWATSAHDFWHQDEISERGTQYREIRMALPNELSMEEQCEVIRDFCRENLERHAYTWALHTNEGRISGKPNPHVHIIFCEREIDPQRGEPSREEYFRRPRHKDGQTNGGYGKSRQITGKNRRKWLCEVRESAERVINTALEKAGREERISCKSLEDQGIDRVPTRHVGAKSVSMYRKGFVTKAMESYQHIRTVNTELENLEKEKRELETIRAMMAEPIIVTAKDLKQAIYKREAAYKAEKDRLKTMAADSKNPVPNVHRRISNCTLAANKLYGLRLQLMKNVSDSHICSMHQGVDDVPNTSGAEIKSLAHERAAGKEKIIDRLISQGMKSSKGRFAAWWEDREDDRSKDQVTRAEDEMYKCWNL